MGKSLNFESVVAARKAQAESVNKQIEKIVSESLHDLQKNLTGCVTATVHECRREMQRTCGTAAPGTPTIVTILICAGMLALSMLTGTLMGKLAYNRFVHQLGEIQTLHDGQRYLVPHQVLRDRKNRIGIPLD